MIIAHLIAPRQRRRAINPRPARHASRTASKTVLKNNLLDRGIIQNGFLILPIEPRHAAALTTLPFHHRDPFDRLIIAQAIIEQITVVSADTALEDYPVKRL
jgi:PIN domain nuclease of toxin-antitoxin system